MSRVHDVWFGLIKKDFFSPWMWLDGTPFVLHNNSFYQTWSLNSSEPSLQPLEDCAYMTHNYDYKWADDYCIQPKWLLCEDIGEYIDGIIAAVAVVLLAAPVAVVVALAVKAVVVVVGAAVPVTAEDSIVVAVVVVIVVIM